MQALVFFTPACLLRCIVAKAERLDDHAEHRGVVDLPANALAAGPDAVKITSSPEHTPGSLGVIEAAMLIGLPQFQKEELLASLLIFRFLYFVFPLFLAAILLGVREAWMTAVAVRRQDS